MTLLPLLALATSPAWAQCSFQLTPQTPTPIPASPVNSVMADYSGDGLLDLAVACQSTGAVLFYPNNGAGAFNPNGTGFGAGANPDGLCTGDFNNDGRPDFASTGHTGVVCIYRNVNGLPSATSTYFCGGATPVGIATADFNQDGNLDLAVTNSGSNNVAVLMGNGAASFGPPTVYPGGGIPAGITVGDFNQDGRPDLAVVNRASNGVVSLYFCNAGGTFTLAATTLPTTLADPRSIVSVDINSDGRLDLAVGSFSSNQNYGTFIATGPGTFSPISTGAIATNPITSLCAADVNADGRLDVLVATGTQVLSRLTGVGNYSSNASSGVRGLSAGDLNGDGLAEVVATGFSVDHYQLFRNTSTSAPTFTQHPQPTTTNPGVNATFSVVNAWSPTFYQWRRGGVNITPGPAYTGGNSPTLTVLNPTLADNLAVFDCIVANSCGTVTSRPAAMGVTDPCGTSDFNGDGDIGTDADIEAFFRVLAGGNC